MLMALFSRLMDLILVLNSMGMERTTGMIPYSDVWRTHRRVIHQIFRSDALPTYEPLQRDMVKSLLKRVLQNPENVVDEVKQRVSSVYLACVTSVPSGHQRLILVLSLYQLCRLLPDKTRIRT